MADVARVKILDIGIADAAGNVHTLKFQMSRDAAKVLAKYLYEVVDLTVNADSEEDHYQATWRKSHPGIRTDWPLIGDEAREEWRKKIDSGESFIPPARRTLDGRTHEGGDK